MNEEQRNRIGWQVLAARFGCKVDALFQGKTVFVDDPRLCGSSAHAAAFGETVLVSASHELLPLLKEAMAQKSRDEVLECPLFYGQSIVYLPHRETKPFSVPQGVTLMRLEGDELQHLSSLSGFSHAVVYDKEGKTDAVCAYLACIDGTVAAVAGAAPEREDCFEIGIEVAPCARGRHLAPLLVQRLTNDLLARGILPIYTASVTNIPSQRTAALCGYRPMWAETYSNILDGNFAYPRDFITQVEAICRKGNAR